MEIVKKTMLIGSLLLISLVASSQVTIGLGEEPEEGALLQLKSKNVPGREANSTKGLLLPRVELDASGSADGHDIAAQLVQSLQITLPSGRTIDAEQHTGLMIYNISEQPVTKGAPFADDKICPGVYVWDGTQWKRVMYKECL